MPHPRAVHRRAVSPAGGAVNGARPGRRNPSGMSIQLSRIVAAAVWSRLVRPGRRHRGRRRASSGGRTSGSSASWRSRPSRSSGSRRSTSRPARPCGRRRRRSTSCRPTCPRWSPTARADEATAAEIIGRVEAARSELGRTRAVMLYRMRRILTSDQHVKLQVLFDERERERHGRGNRARPSVKVSESMINVRTLAPSCACVACPPPPGAQAQDVPARSPRPRRRRPLRGRTRQRRADRRRRRASRRRPRPLRDLRLDEAVELALAQNLDIAVERLSPQVTDFQIAGLRNAYRPVASSSLGQRSQVNPPTNQLNGGQRVANDTTTYNFGVAQDVPWGGGNFLLTLQQQPAGDHQPVRQLQPELHLDAHRHLQPAAAARLPHRQPSGSRSPSPR